LNRSVMISILQKILNNSSKRKLCNRIRERRSYLMILTLKERKMTRMKTIKQTTTK